MKKIILGVLLFFLAVTVGQAQLPVKVMTYNIRLDVQSDGDNTWSRRKTNFASMIRYHKADIVGLQEALRNQIDDIIRELPEYAWCGVGRDDGKDAGECMAILYRKDRFTVQRTATFWCSPTPEKPGRGWDAAYNRVVTWGRFFDRKNVNDFFLFNTHLDNEGKQARRESARLLLDSITSIAGVMPAIITGDFNSSPEDEPYRMITRTDARIHFYDTWNISVEKPHGPHGTFNGFSLPAAPLELIDYIFVTDGIRVLSHGTLSETFNGRYPSDHFPVLAEIVFDAHKK